MYILIAILAYLLINILMCLRHNEATGVMAILAAIWTVVASWVTVTALCGDLDSESWTATHAHSFAVAYLPLILLGAGLASGSALSGWVSTPADNYLVAHENRSILTVVLVVLPLMTIIGTAVAFGICIGLIQPVDGLPSTVVHDFGINGNMTNLDPGWSTFQHETRVAFLHTVFSASASGLALLALAGGGLFGFVTGRFIERR